MRKIRRKGGIGHLWVIKVCCIGFVLGTDLNRVVVHLLTSKFEVYLEKFEKSTIMHCETRNKFTLRILSPRFNCSWKVCDKVEDANLGVSWNWGFVWRFLENKKIVGLFHNITKHYNWLFQDIFYQLCFNLFAEHVKNSNSWYISGVIFDCITFNISKEQKKFAHSYTQ